MPSTVVGPGRIIADRYRIEGWLGQGGMGSVYRAVQLSVRRTVALKRLVDEHLESPSHLERFEREALALSRLNHQSTVRLFDFGSDEQGCPFIVMEFLEGSDLAADLERHGPMRWDQALAVAIRILGSLGEAHASGIVHRDIKPANVFLCAGAEWPVVKVLDFGIAGGAEPRAGVRKLTLTGTVLGSAPYMSPEQAQGLPAGPAADLYSVGVVLFEMLTGRTPFEARPFTAQLIAKVLEVAPGLRDVCPELDAPPEVQALVACLLEREPSRRPPSARATVERLEALLAQAALPALARSEQRPGHVSPPVVKTQPMLVPRTIDEGWTPPKAEPPSPRSRRALGGLLLVAGAAASTGLWHALPARSDPTQSLEPEAAVAAVVTLPASNADASELDGGASVHDARAGTGAADAGAPPGASQPLASNPPRPAVRPLATPLAELAEADPAPARARGAAASSFRPTSRRSSAQPAARASLEASGLATESAARRPSVPGETPAAAAPAPEPSSPPALDPEAPVTPETLVLPRTAVAAEAPATEPTGNEPPSASAPASAEAPAELPSVPPSAALGRGAEPRRDEPISDPRYWTIAAARAAARRGDLTPRERNEIVAALQQRRLEARARAARAYREGRIEHEELLRRQRAIDRRIDGW